MSIWNDTLAKLNAQRDKSDSILVAYSGGKDSLAILDLCSRTFKRVVCFYMYFVPGLESIETQLQYARYRWGVEILYYPHWTLIKAIRSGFYCNQNKQADDMPELSLRDVYDWARLDTGMSFIATGAKDSDSLWRRRFFHATRTWDDMVYPIREWQKIDVLAYLQMRKIPVPDMSKTATATGVDLSTPSILFMHDNFPEDFKKIERWFPYVRAVVKRRDWFGVS